MDRTKIDLRTIDNPECLKNCAEDVRDQITDGDICAIATSALDGLPVRCVGEWAFEKIYYLRQYFGIFVNGMKNKWKMNYIEVCCGPGRCITRHNGEEIDGTSLCVANHESFNLIQKAIFLDNDPQAVEILNKRLDSLGKGHIAKSRIGDYNDVASLMSTLKELPERCLNLVFVDPTDCSVPFSTIASIKEHLGRIDLVVTAGFGTDLRRNITNAVLNPSYGVAKKKYTDFLGKSDFFEREEVLKYAEAKDHKRLVSFFVEEYKVNLAKLGFEHTDMVPVRRNNFLYLLYATSNPKGLEFWQKAVHISPYSQYRLDI
ncbi:MAG: three-Cys-motif partner protein TcmP [Chloroflexi bacterium]|jgi:three-Cys-motif partner protein|nr:three-Cys-motif partner protein TcmP [Chloroflexota bacterium]